MIITPERRAENKRVRNFIPPLRLLAVLLGVLFLGEGLIMLALPYLLPGSLESYQVFADPLMLVLFSTPFIWVLIVRPLRNALSREKVWAGLLLERIVDGVIVADGNRAVTSINRAAELMFGYSAAEAKDIDLCQLFADCEEVERLAGTRIEEDENKPPVSQEGTGRRKDGTTFPVGFTLSRVHLGGEIAFIAIIRDITKRKELEKRLINGERNATIAVVASSIGHELNNAVTAQLGYAELLSEDPGDPKLAADAAAVFLAQSGALAAHAANLLSIGKPRTPVFEEVRLGDYLAELTSVLKVSGVLKRIKVVEEHEPGQPPVMGDKGLLEQVFRNLEINGAQAMDGRGTLTIVSRAEGDGFVRVDVSDTGCGIAPEFMPNVFEPFRTTKGDRGGTGLGMYIARKIVEQHGGTIDVTSRVGEWTTVTVRLPVQNPSVKTQNSLM